MQLSARGGLFLSPLRRGFFCFGDGRQAPGDLKKEKLAGRKTFLGKGSPSPRPSLPKTFIRSRCMPREHKGHCATVRKRKRQTYGKEKCDRQYTFFPSLRQNFPAILRAVVGKEDVRAGWACAASVLRDVPETSLAVRGNTCWQRSFLHTKSGHPRTGIPALEDVSAFATGPERSGS